MRKDRIVSSLAAAAALLALAPSAALAQGKEVHLLSWGGTIQTMLEKEGWADRFKKETGYTLTLVPKATSSEIIATAIAQKGKPQVDVVLCDMVAYLQGVEQGIFATLDRAKVPNLAKMVDLAWVKDGKGVMTYVDVVGMMYQEDVFKRKGWAPPKSWADIMRPELRTVCEEAVDSPSGKRQFARARFLPSGAVVPTGTGQGSHVMGGLAIADALIVIPEDVTRVSAGDTVTVIDLRSR